MNFQRLLERLSLLRGTGGVSSSPLAEGFQPILEQLGGQTTVSTMELLNEAVGCMEAKEIYCEVGCQSGIHLVAALKGHPDRIAYAVESPIRLDSESTMFESLVEHLTALNLQEQVFFCAQTTEEFFADLEAVGLEELIGVYFYNGETDYRSQLLALLLATPFLAERALIVLGHAELGMVRQAAWDFLAAYPQATLQKDLSNHRGHLDYGCGLLLLAWDSVSSRAPVKANAQPREEIAIEMLQTLAHHQSAMNLESLRSQASQLVIAGRLEDAEQTYQTILLYDRGDPVAWESLGMVRYLLGKNEAALDALSQVFQLQAQSAVTYQMTGLVLERLDRKVEAEESYRQAIALNPLYADALNNLGELLMRQAALHEAEGLFRRAIAAVPEQAVAYANLGDVLLKLDRRKEAIAQYHKAVKLNKQNAAYWQKLSEAYQAEEDCKQANLCTLYSLYFQHQHEEAIAHFLTHSSLDQVETFDECLALSDCYAQSGFPEQVVRCLERAAQLRPEDAFLQVAPQLVLPMVYQTPEEIPFYRERYIKGYAFLKQQVEQANKEGRSINFQSLENITNFHISYQGFNDRPFHSIYASLRHQWVAERHPEFVKPLPMPPPGENGKIRIGYIAESLGNNSETRWAIGWLKNHDLSQFEVYCYSINTRVDLQAQQFRALSDAFYPLPTELDLICKQIQSDQLHVLVFLALGARVKIGSIAALRLAPVQCSAWGNPVTSGFPTIDYFLSNELMEPDNAQEHYSEQLIRLPNVGICYLKPHFPSPTKTRADFGLRDDAIVYLSCQLIFKYLPQHDYLFVEIVRRVPTAQLVFVLRSTQNNQVNPNLEQQFRQRLQKAFASADLVMEDYCIFLPGQDSQGYSSLLACADAFLDTLEYSGGYTTLDAIAANLPVVCCPGQLMRGRQSYGFLQLLGVTETIASTEAEYIDIAVKLGLEPEWRQAIAQRMSENHPNLFEDTACVAGLEQFYREVVQDRLNQQSLSSSSETPASTIKRILHVGCGPYNPESLPKVFRTSEWHEVRLDINPAVHPDIIGSITDMSAVPIESMDAVYSSHNLEHVYAHEVSIALAEFYRVLKPGGRAIITLPDIQKVAEYVARGQLEETLYVSPAGPISAIDILYGLRSAIAEGNYFMAHRTAFTCESLSQKLKQAGFSKVDAYSENLNIWAVGHK